MRKLYLLAPILVICAVLSWQFFQSRSATIHSNPPATRGSEQDAQSEDGIRLAQEQEFELTRDIQLGYIPKDRLVQAYSTLMEQRNAGLAPLSIGGFTWTERGSNSDATGPSNGNTRANNGVTSGRMRAIWVDLADPTHKTVWVGGIDGGIWKTTDITASPATWTLINDFFSNLAIGGICQDPTNNNIMYFGTGEKAFNADAVRGGGIWKSTDHGVNWNLLPNTTGFWNVAKILCDGSGNVYVATISSGQGLERSTDGGTTWHNITPATAGGGTRVPDMVISSTGRLHVCKGYFNSATNQSGYFFTDNPATVDSLTWSTPTTPFSPENFNCMLTVKGDTLYVLNANSSFQTPQVNRSFDGGVTWGPTPTSPPAASGTNDLSSGQGWYNLAISVDSTNGKKVLVGGLNCYRTTDAGATWTQVSHWVGLTGPYIHADQHIANWNGAQVLVGSDGGIFYSADSGVTYTDRNVGLRLKQFYSCAIHPTTTNYFLAGAQDNGCHQFTMAGLGSSVEVTGGDGAFVHIDQAQPQFQFGSYVFNQYRRSTDGGSSWSPVNFSSSIGQFINPTDYDSGSKKFYASGNAGQFIRWENPQTGSTFTTVSVAAFSTGGVRHVRVSPFTSNRVFFGLSTGKIIKADNANTATPTTTDITGSGMSASTVSCVAPGTDDNNLLATFSNYGSIHVWVTTTGGGSSGWTNITGNLPDIPVRWAMFFPNDNTQAILATEMGIFETTAINGSSTVWTQDGGFPFVRTDMLKYRSSDRTLAAATHGRGLWTTTIPVPLPITLLDFSGRLQDRSIPLEWTTGTELNSNFFEVQKSSDGKGFHPIGRVKASGNSSMQEHYEFTDRQVAEVNYYRLNTVDLDGKSAFSKVILVRAPGTSQQIWIGGNPFHSSLTIRFAKQPQEVVKFDLTNMSGAVLFHKEYGSSTEVSLDLSGVSLIPGTYVLRTMVDGQTFVHKVVKQ